MDTNHSYWKYAERVNGRLAMLGLIIGTVNYVLFGEIGWAAMLGFVAAVGAYATTGNIIPGIF